MYMYIYIYIYIYTHPAALLVKPIQPIFSQPILEIMVARCNGRASKGKTATKGNGVRLNKNRNTTGDQACAFRALMKYRSSEKCVKAMQR